MTNFDAIQAINTAIATKTDAERDEEARFQAEQRAKLNLPTEIDIRAQLGARMVAAAEQALAEHPSEFETNRYAEGLALQGEYRKALELTQCSVKRAEYQAIVNGIDNPVDCACPKKRGQISTIFTKDRIFAEGRVREVLACALCGHIKC
jgi:hypothetical protein